MLIVLGGGGGAALQAAAGRGDEQTVQLLLDAGADAKSEPCGLYGSALQAETFHGHEEIVRLLLDAGADVNSMGGLGSALGEAVKNGYSNISQLLRLHGAKDVEN
jgi:ankyrin repeat protein